VTFRDFTMPLSGWLSFALVLLQDLLKQEITPNIYVYNSLMNVNAHDLSYILHVHKNMQVMLHLSLSLSSHSPHKHEVCFFV
jgi:hypothetical protein